MAAGGLMMCLAVCSRARLVCVSRTLSPLSAEMTRYELEVDLWLEKRAIMLAELARIKYVHTQRQHESSFDHRRRGSSTMCV